MKKSLFIIPLALCAMVVTSCSSVPPISREQALAEYEAIQQHAEERGDFKAGNKLTMELSSERKQTANGQSASLKQNTTYVVDLENYYTRLSTTTTETYMGQSVSSSVEAYVYVKDEVAYYGYIEKENNQITSDDEGTFEFDDTVITERILTIYSTVTGAFDSACTAIFTYLNKLTTPEAMKQAGVTLGSHGAGSLVIEEHINQKVGAVEAKSDTVIEFADYKLALMKSEYKQVANGASNEGKLLYTFDYTKAELVY